ncbi:Predicted arabinose efflux permease, MFS family [Kytococcus aerolatus]|uniref:Predicted arabinose efflux permease, MFS family n=1 Tax=Kytococcus aerolatus TaxID=592308 RepID=A0A212TE28_9MICO|nr:MFS transporter [Kytococcus aerolatus]SNC64282.1 Predicted arabinose efflux permease, MFS family [Kytococcus aerolatus]
MSSPAREDPPPPASGGLRAAWRQPVTPGGPTLGALAVSAYAPALLWSVALAGVLPVLALLALRIGATPGQAALVVSLHGLSSMVLGMPAGMLTERIGERRAMTGAALLGAVAMAVVAVTDSVPLLALGVMMLGAAACVFMLARQSYLTGAFPRHQLARAMSTLGGMARVGFFVGPVVAAGAISLWGLRGPVVVSLVLLALLSLATLRLPALPGEERVVRSSPRRAGSAPVRMRDVVREHRRTIVTLGFGFVLCAAARSSRTVLMPLWGAHIGVSEELISLLVGLAGLVEVLTFYPAGLIMDRVSRRANAIPSMAILGLGIALVPLTGTAGALALVVVVIGFGNGLGSGIVMTLSGDAAPERGRTSFLAVMRTLSDAGAAGGPLVLSGVTAVAGLAAGVWAASAFGFGAAAAFARWVPRARPAGPARTGPTRVSPARRR